MDSEDPCSVKLGVQGVGLRQKGNVLWARKNRGEGDGGAEGKEGGDFPECLFSFPYFPSFRYFPKKQRKMENKLIKSAV